tara:strand:- start:193 stop:426 length:234 start_codon:yes stop_codon:yes gene_type:complete
MTEQEKKEPIYVGKGLEKFDGNLIEISVCLTEASKHKYTYEGKEYVRLKVSKRKEADNWGKTHSVAINQWTPKKEEY